MSDNERPEQKTTPDLKFVIAVAAVGCFFGVVLETWWVLIVGVLVTSSAYLGRRLFLPLMAKMRPDSRRRGLSVVWIAVTLLGLVLVVCALWLHHRMGGSYLAIPEIVGAAGIWIVFQGTAKVRQLASKTPPDEGARP